MVCSQKCWGGERGRDVCIFMPIYRYLVICSLVGPSCLVKDAHEEKNWYLGLNGRDGMEGVVTQWLKPEAFLNKWFPPFKQRRLASSYIITFAHWSAKNVNIFINILFTRLGASREVVGWQRSTDKCASSKSFMAAPDPTVIPSVLPVSLTKFCHPSTRFKLTGNL